MMDSDTTIENLIPMIRDILDGKDLSTMTPKIVREAVLAKLDTPPVNHPKFKSNVKTALTAVLAECARDDSNPAEKSNPEVKDEPNARSAVLRPSEKIQIVVAAAKPTTETTPAAPVKEAETEKESKSIKGKNDDDSPKELNSKDSKSVQQKKRKSTGEDDFEDVKRARMEKPGKTGKDSSKTVEKKKMKDKDDDEGDDNDDNDDNNDTFKYDDELISGDEEEKKSKKVKKVKRQGSKAKRERVSTSSGVKNTQYEKLNAVVRAVGLRMPASRLKGKSPDQRCEAVREFLKSKGVDEPFPTSLTRKELQVHKKRLEREKDMIDIDVRYVPGLHFDGRLSADCATCLYANHVSLTISDFCMSF